MEEDDSRRRVLADRLGDLPDCLLHEVLSHLGSRQVGRTSVLSRRWRHLWRDVPCVDLDQRDFDLHQWDTFEAFADHMFHLRPAAPPPLDTFRLHLAGSESSTPNIWIRRGLERFPSAVDIRGCFAALTTWPDDASAGSRLTRLRLLQVMLPGGFGQRIGEQCPVIEGLHLEECWSRRRQLGGITSPTLRSLTVTRHHDSFSAGELVAAAPRLASLRLDVRNDGCAIVHLGRSAAAQYGSGEAVLGSLVAASICVETTSYHDTQSTKQRKRHFWSSIRSLLHRAPNLTNLQLHGFTTTAFLDVQFAEFPMLLRLTTLLLHKCDVIGANFNFEALTTILANTPNLDKLGLHNCCTWSLQQPSSCKLRRRSTAVAATSLVCKKKLKSVEIKGGAKSHLLHFLSQKFSNSDPMTVSRYLTATASSMSECYD